MRFADLNKALAKLVWRFGVGPSVGVARANRRPMASMALRPGDWGSPSSQSSSIRGTSRYATIEKKFRDHYKNDPAVRGGRSNGTESAGGEQRAADLDEAGDLDGIARFVRPRHHRAPVQVLAGELAGIGLGDEP